MKKTLLFLVVLVVASALWAQSRHALVIGNENYPHANAKLPNALNDTRDIQAALKELGYRVELKHNLQRLDMIREVNAFIARLKSDRNSEGFFWYAGHAIEIDRENFLMPLDVSVDEGKEIIKATSYSVTELTRQLDDVRNKVNVIVLDACRAPPSGDRTKSFGDASRVIKTVSDLPPDILIIYSTASGAVASDGGKGDRNSPFAKAFLKHINSTEPLTVMISDVARETLSLTQQQQRPYHSGSLYNDGRYSLNPKGVRPPPPPPEPPRPPTKTAKEYYDSGVAFYNRKDYNTAIEELTAAIRLDPNYADAYFKRGDAYDENKDYERAIADYTQAIKINPTSTAYYYRGLAYKNKKDYDRAIADYNQAIKLNPNYALAYYNRGLAYYNGNKDYDRAIADYNQAIKLNLDYAKAYFSRGLAYQNKNDYERAIADYNQAIKLNPNYADAYNNRGNVYQNKNDYEWAIADYNQAIKIDPNDAVFYNNRGNAYRKTNDYERAIADYNQAIRLDPNYALAYNNRGLAYEKKGDMTRANADKAKARELGYKP